LYKKFCNKLSNINLMSMADICFNWLKKVNNMHIVDHYTNLENRALE